MSEDKVTHVYCKEPVEIYILTTDGAFYAACHKHHTEFPAWRVRLGDEIYSTDVQKSQNDHDAQHKHCIVLYGEKSS